MAPDLQKRFACLFARGSCKVSQMRRYRLCIWIRKCRRPAECDLDEIVELIYSENCQQARQTFRSKSTDMGCRNNRTAYDSANTLDQVVNSGRRNMNPITGIFCYSGGDPFLQKLGNFQQRIWMFKRRRIHQNLQIEVTCMANSGIVLSFAMHLTHGANLSVDGSSSIWSSKAVKKLSSFNILSTCIKTEWYT